MQIADGKGEGVGGVVWLRRLFEFQKDAHHLLHLMLLGRAITDDRLLHEARRILRDLPPPPLRRPHDPKRHQLITPRVTFDDAPTRRLAARINPKNTHQKSALADNLFARNIVVPVAPSPLAYRPQGSCLSIEI